MANWINTRSGKRNPFGGWLIRRSLAETIAFEEALKSLGEGATSADNPTANPSQKDRREASPRRPPAGSRVDCHACNKSVLRSGLGDHLKQCTLISKGPKFRLHRPKRKGTARRKQVRP